MKWIDYSSPNSIDEAISILSGQKGKAKSLAGGTDLIVQMRAAPQRLNNPDIIVDIKSIPELNQVEFGSNGLTIGAAVPCHKIYQNSKIAARNKDCQRGHTLKNKRKRRITALAAHSSSF